MEEKKAKKQEIIETEIQMGTVHPAALEPYRVRFFVEDEIVKDAEITIGVNHRGIERIMEGLPVEKANMLTEKICGICSNSHVWNSVRTAEKGLEVEVPERAVYIRVIVGELERLHSHLLYLAHGCEVLGHETFSMRIFYIRETIMELLGMIGGNRVQYGCSLIGGVRPRCELDDNRIRRILEGMDVTEKRIADFADRFLHDSIVLSRRTDMYEYENFDFDIITQDTCDVKAQLIMRVLESFEAIKIIRQAIRDLPEGKIADRSWEMIDTDIIESYIEVPRGTCYHSYAIEDGRVRGSIVRTPSMSNIGAMQYASIGNHITDAQLCIVQCDPCFTCSDRAMEVYDMNNNKLDKSILNNHIIY